MKKRQSTGKRREKLNFHLIAIYALHQCWCTVDVEVVVVGFFFSFNFKCASLDENAEQKQEMCSENYFE